MMVRTLPGLLLVASAVQASPVIGSPNTVTADPPVAHPHTTPCRVQLFADVDFADFSPKPFDYTPPAGCPGPWQKVVLEADYSVDPGRQFDRTATLWIGGVNVYFGTTAEPTRRPNPIGRSWHVERDITDYTAALLAPAAGRAELGNLVNSTYTSHLHGSADLAFYPLGDDDERGPRTADIVLPLSASATGGTVPLFSESDQLSRTFALPTNVERAYLDVILQHQGANDEFWYTCVPGDLSGPLQSCAGSAFREGEVSIDGQPAAVVPIFPWIFTGGIDPYLWRPIPAVQALNFVPYRVDITPFAGVLSDGRPHTFAIDVSHNSNYFQTTATLMLFLDHGSRQVTGAVTANTIGAPNPQIDDPAIDPNANPLVVTLKAISSRSFVLAGWARTSHGRVQTEIRQTIDFSNVQNFSVANGGAFEQKIDQLTSISSTTTVRGGDGPSQTSVHMSWPLTVDIFSADDFNSGWTTRIHQAYGRSVQTGAYGYVLSNSGDWADDYPTTTIQSGAQRYFFSDSEGRCYSRSIVASHGVLASVVDGAGCDD